MFSAKRKNTEIRKYRVVMTLKKKRNTQRLITDENNRDIHRHSDHALGWTHDISQKNHGRSVLFY
jgi:hypothetical protein